MAAIDCEVDMMRLAKCIAVLFMLFIFATTAFIIGCDNNESTSNGPVIDGSGKPTLIFFHSPG